MGFCRIDDMIVYGVGVGRYIMIYMVGYAYGKLCKLRNKVIIKFRKRGIKSIRKKR